MTRKSGYARKGVLEVLQDKLEILPPTHKALGHFLLTHFQEAVFLTASQLAKKTGTSEASVVRFARSLGCGGFSELREELQVLLREKLLPAERIQQAGGIPLRSEAILDRVMDVALSNIRETRKLLNPRALDEAARAIASAHTRYVIGLNASAGAATLLGHQLRKIQPEVRVLTEGGPVLFDSVLSISKGDAVLAISYPRYAKWTAEVLRYAAHKKARTIAITDSRLSPVGQIAELALIARVNTITFGCSYVAPMLAIDALLAAIFGLNRDESLARLDLVERMIEGHDFFFGSPLPNTD